MRRVIQIEFNELSPTLLDELIGAGELPNFERLRSTSEVFVTDASAEDSLEPWVQWPTLHTGISDHVHGIRNLGEADRVAGRGIARELAAAGFRVGVFGSMNMDYGPLDGFVVPDPWNAAAPAHPPEVRAFTDFVGSAVQESSSNSLDRAKAVRFVRYMATHGLAPSTATAAARQLLAEREDGGVGWRRSLILDQMSYDVFRNLVRRHRVGYATFFSNSTAHFQHYYWRDFRPEAFTRPPDADAHPSLADAVLDGYRAHDALIGRFMEDFPEDRLVLATALSQQPWDTDKCTYRPADFHRLLSAAGVDASRVDVEPIMAEEFYLVASDDATARSVESMLADSTVAGRDLFRFEASDGGRFKAGCAVNEWSDDVGSVQFANGASAPFHDLFHRIHSVRSGRHHPDGALWIQSRSPRRVATKVPLTAVAPTILALYGVAPPPYMTEAPIATAEAELAMAGAGAPVEATSA